MLHENTVYKYEIPYNAPFVITQCFTNVTVNLQCVAIKITYIIRRIKPYKFDTKVEDITPKIFSDDINI